MNLPRLMLMTLWVCLVTSGCAPTARYTQGPALFPENLTSEELEQTKAAEEVSNIGDFDISTEGCGNLGSTAVDQNRIGPAIRNQLDKMGANAAENIRVSERPENSFSGWLVAPALAGCVAWSVSGDALRIGVAPEGSRRELAPPSHAISGEELWKATHIDRAAAPD